MRLVLSIAFGMYFAAPAPTVVAQSELPECEDRLEYLARRARAGTSTGGGAPMPAYHGFRYGGPMKIGNDGPEWDGQPTITVVFCDSPASKVGLRAGDVLISVNGRDAREPRVIVSDRVGKKLNLVVERAGQTLEFQVVTEARPSGDR